MADRLGQACPELVEGGNPAVVNQLLKAKLDG